MLRQLAPDLWCVERPQRFFGVAIGARMTVVRLHSGELFLHSPVRLDNDLREELAGLGRVGFIVAPNRMHHLYVGDYINAYPNARSYASPALSSKRADLAFTDVLEIEPPPGWAAQLDQHLFAPVLGEVVFFHRTSRTLILTDLVANIQHWPNRTSQLLLRADGICGRLALPRAIRFPIVLCYRKAARAALNVILAWDFDRIVMAHGEVLDRGGRAALQKSYSFL